MIDQKIPETPYDIGITSNTLQAGGAEMQRVLLANGLSSRGHRVSLYCLQDTGPLEKLINDAVTIVRTPFWKGPAKQHDVLITGTTNTETFFGLLSRRTLSRRPYWMTAIHNPVGNSSPNLDWLARRGLSWADCTVALTTDHAQRIKDHWGVASTEIISNGVEMENYTAARIRRSSQVAFDYDVGYIGRLATEHKGLDVLLQALSYPPADTLRVAIAGSGPDSVSLKAMAQSLQVDSRIDWLGHQSAADFLTRVAVLAVPSRYEGQPMVLLEAMAVGVPVVASSFAGATPNADVTITDIADPEAVASDLFKKAQEQKNGDQQLLPPSTDDMVDGYIAAMSNRANVRFLRRRKSKSSKRTAS